MDKQKEISIGFQLNGIQTLQFATFPKNLVEGKEANIDTNINFHVTPEHHIVSVSCRLEFLQKKNVFLMLEIGCHFSIAPDTWDSLLDKKNNEVRLPKGFATHLAVLTIGTARGVLHAETKDTPMNNYPLPTLNLTKMITKDAVIPLGKDNK
jgi:hypothetical protein